MINFNTDIDSIYQNHVKYEKDEKYRKLKDKEWDKFNNKINQGLIKSIPDLEHKIELGIESKIMNDYAVMMLDFANRLEMK